MERQNYFSHNVVDFKAFYDYIFFVIFKKIFNWREYMYTIIVIS